MTEKKTALITGANSGIGFYTALALLKEGYRCILLIRDSQKSVKALEQLKQEVPKNAPEMVGVDLSSMASIEQAIEEVKQKTDSLDILINNAGLLSRERVITAEGHELTIAVNYLAPVLLSEKLLPLLQSRPDARIVQLSSTLYKRGKLPERSWHQSGRYDGTRMYANSKAMLVMYTLHNASRFYEHGVKMNVLHPGVIATDVFREFPAFLRTPLMWVLKKPEKGAEPSIRLATSKGLIDVYGRYYHEKKEEQPTKYVKDSDLQLRLMDYTKQMLDI